MAIFRRSSAPLGGSQPEIEAPAPPDDGPEAVADSGRNTPDSSDGRRVAATGPAPRAFALKPEDLLPDAQVSERARRGEQRLVEAACRGEASAVEALYRSNFDAIYRYVLLRIGSPSAAEDVTSQVFLGMVRGLGRYQDRGKPFVAWLYGIAQKQIAFFQRGQNRTPSALDLEEASELAGNTAGPAATVEQRETQAAIAKALAQVPEGQREVILLRYILSLSLAETAAVIGRTEGAVKQLQLRALSTLKTILDREGHGFL
jgi:RNA polymerase sigma-70 factor, ECF subfamily